jgi:phenylpyruvate tautomerase PptA (4-oxalocrotonate tautomerase family)
MPLINVKLIENVFSPDQKRSTVVALRGTPAVTTRSQR